MKVIKAPAGFGPTWPALPVDPPAYDLNSTTHPCRTYHHQNDAGECCYPLDHLAALLGPKDCEWCRGTGRHIERDDGYACPPCNGSGKVPQRVALAIETPCETCDGMGRFRQAGYRTAGDCLGCAGSGVRLRVEYTAQVDAVVPVLALGADPSPGVNAWVRHVAPTWSDRDLNHVYLWDVGRNRHTGDAYWSVSIDPFPDADWSPGRVAVIISDVRPFDITQTGRSGFHVPVPLCPFDGPVAELSEVLS